MAPVNRKRINPALCTKRNVAVLLKTLVWVTVPKTATMAHVIRVANAQYPEWSKFGCVKRVRVMPDKKAHVARESRELPLESLITDIRGTDMVIPVF
jgi:hypothetical protein